MLRTDSDNCRDYVAEVYRRSIDEAIADEIAHEPPNGYKTKPYDPAQWVEYWSARIHYMYGIGPSDCKGQYRGPTGPDLIRYIIEERRRRTLPEIPLEPRPVFVLSLSLRARLMKVQAKATGRPLSLLDLDLNAIPARNLVMKLRITNLVMWVYAAAILVMKLLRSRCVVCAAILSSGMLGCSTVAVHADKHIDPEPYLGTKLAVKETKRSWNAPRYYGESLIVVYDIPLSFVADTVLLPLDAYLDQKNGMEPGTSLGK